jgi:hypothetical protein
VADLGGGRGILLAAILAAHPGLRGILLDLPQALTGAEDVLRAARAGDRCELVPGGADAYLLKSVIHDWDDERAVAILANVRAAMSPAAVLLLAAAGFAIERIIPCPPTGYSLIEGGLR